MSLLLPTYSGVFFRNYAGMWTRNHMVDTLLPQPNSRAPPFSGRVPLITGGNENSTLGKACGQQDGIY